MGNFYVNYTLKGPDQSDVVRILDGRRAAVTIQQRRCVVVFDEESDVQDIDVVAELSSMMSEKLACPVFAVVNHDDDVLIYQLRANGELVDEYSSSPGYFDDGPPEPPSGGDAARLTSTFGASDSAVVESILRKSSDGKDGYIFEIDRHRDLVRALDLPEWAVGTSYEGLAAGEYPEGLTEADLHRTAR